MPKLAVVAVGGNALILDETRRSVADQYTAARECMRHIADLIENGWQVVITHGNGPQVGFVLRRSELARQELPELPLDACGANTQGEIGYQFQKALRNEFARRGLPNSVATVVTQTQVDLNDPAFAQPTKPIGSFMSEAVAKEKMANENWNMVEDAGRGWRRVVASPKPQAILELAAIQTLIASGVTVIASGGGGIPVARTALGEWVGVEAVIDKDYASALLAYNLHADVFVISTAVEKVALNYNKPNQRWLEKISVAEARAYQAEGHFHKGSMAPKIEAAISFIERGGQWALITNPENLGRAINQETGTWIVA